jgi:hypothetical protein
MAADVVITTIERVGLQRRDSMESTRRSFFKEFFVRKTVTLVAEVQKCYRQAESDAEYFQSFENSYPLISEYMQFMDDEVKTLGIDTEGKSKHEVAEEIYHKTQGRN